MSKRCRRYLFLAAVCVLLLCPTAGGAAVLDEIAGQALNCGVPEASVNSVQAAVGRGRIAEPQAGLLLEPLLAACVEQLPVSPLADKLAEGLAKRVPAPFIVKALNKRLESYRFARTLLLTRTGSLDESALNVIGSGVDEGVSQDDFELYVAEFSKIPSQIFLTGLTMVSLQGQAGVDAELTRRIVRYGIANENLDAGWRYFVRVILTARQRGIDDATVAEGAVAVLSRGGVVSDVMEEIGFTGRPLGEEEN